MGKHSSVVVQLPLDPDPGGVSPLLSSHLLPEGRGTLASTLSPHVPRVAQLSLGVSVQNSYRSDSTSATRLPSLPQGPYPAHAGGHCSAECQQ